MAKTVDTEELRQIIEQAQDGNWLPLVSIAGVFTIVIFLLIYIWNLTLKANDKRHSNTEKLLEEVVELAREHQTSIAELKTIIQHHDRILFKDK